MKIFIAPKKIKRNCLCFIFALFILTSTLTAPWIVKVSLYIFTLAGLIYIEGFKKAIKSNFLNYSVYLLFILLCLFSYILLDSNDLKFSESPQIENMIALFILFVFILVWRESYSYFMNVLVFVTTLYLIISLPIHYFYFESSLLSATAFFSPFESEALSNKNTLGILLSLCFPFCLFKLSDKVNFYNLFLVVLFNTAIFYTFSRAALILSGITTLLFLFSFRTRLVKASLLSIVSSVMLLFIYDISPQKYNQLKSESNNQVIEHNYADSQTNDIYLTNEPNKTFSSEGARFNYIKLSVEGFFEKPLFGHGITSFRKNHETLDVSGQIVRKPVTHNDFAQILYEMGLLGLLSFLSLFIFNFLKVYMDSSLKSDLSLTIFFQLITLAIALNSGNYIDHSVFWMFMGITLLNINRVPSQ